jgi:hypothetical protein
MKYTLKMHIGFTLYTTNKPTGCWPEGGHQLKSVLE